ncbi:MAG: M48 family metalloprotease [Fimbriimonadaceae bacterium]|nr:M48 family metalloprotease [Fimbriimonadaceae bacterium]
MGKRMTAKPVKLPTINVRKLRDPNETVLKLFGAGVPFLAYLAVIGISMFAIEKTAVIGRNLIYWLVIGGVSVLVLAAGQRKKLVKQFPRSKVTGSQNPEVRLQLVQLCKLFDIKKLPDAYVVETAEIAVAVRGLGNPYLVISSRLLQILTPREFEAVLAAQLGHIKAGTVFWRSFVMLLNEARGIWPVVCLPYLLMAKLLVQYLEATNHTADRIALLALDGDYHLMVKIIIKLVSYSSDSISDEQRRQLQAFLDKQSLEARAEDVEHQMILGRMLRLVPGLKERIDNLAGSEGTTAFERELATLQARREALATTR